MLELNTDLISLLKYFNRKERFFLIGQALGNKDFNLSDDFRNVIAKKLNLEIPKDAFVAMDYHLDWIYASLYCAKEGTTRFIGDNTKLRLNSNQEDIDLLIAFEKASNYHLVLIEAKAESGWTNKQLSSKSKRFKQIFGVEQCLWNNVQPNLLLTSPRMPLGLQLNVLPNYLFKSIEEIWFQLEISKKLLKITRCNELGQANINGTNWKVEKTTRDEI